MTMTLFWPRTYLCTDRTGQDVLVLLNVSSTSRLYVNSETVVSRAGMTKLTIYSTYQRPPLVLECMCGSRGRDGGPETPPTPLKNHKNIGFLSNIG